MQEKNDNRQNKPWQPRWWQDNPERWRWAGTIALVIMLVGVFAYQNPGIWQDTQPLQLAEEDAGEALPEPPQDVGGAVLSAPLLADENLISDPLPTDENPSGAPVGGAALSAPLLAGEQPAADAEDAEPAGMQQLEAATAVAVSAPPASWQQPGYGVWAREYGYALDPTQGDYRFHQGCDMELSVGSPVFAAATGQVLLAAEDAAWGGVVIIEHGGGWRSIYRGIKPEISVGAALVAGEQIGLVLSSPPAEQAQASHLHFELERDSKRQNPADWL